MQFPVPSRLPLGPLMDFGYDDNTAFPVKISVAPSVKPGPVHLDAIAEWFICREVCVPGRAHLGIDLNVLPGAPAGQLLGTVGESINQLPKPIPPGASLSILGGKTEFVVTVLNAPKVETGDVEFYPIDQDLIVNSADQDVETVPNGFRIRIPRADDPNKPGAYPPLPATLHGSSRPATVPGMKSPVLWFAATCPMKRRTPPPWSRRPAVQRPAARRLHRAHPLKAHLRASRPALRR